MNFSSRAWLFRRFCWRAIWIEPGRALLLVLSIALSVSILLAIFNASSAAISSFQRVVGVFDTKNEIILRAPYGRDLVAEAPQLLTYLAPYAKLTFGSEYLGTLIDGDKKRELTVLAVDLLAAQVNREIAQEQDDHLMHAFVTKATKQQLNLGNQINLAFNDKVFQFKLNALPSDQSATDGVVVIDISTAARVLGDEFKLQFAGVKIEAALLKKLSPQLKHLAPDVVIQTPQDLNQRAKKLYAAFELNIAMMVVVAFLVTIFTIYTSALLVATRRQHLIAVLRTLGVSRSNILWLLLTEAGVLGAIGGITGSIMGRPITSVAASSIIAAAQRLYSSGAALVLPAKIDFTSALLIGLIAGVLTAILGFLIPTLTSSKSSAALAARRITEPSVKMRVRLLWITVLVFLTGMFEYFAQQYKFISLAYLEALLIFILIYLISQPVLALVVRAVPALSTQIMIAKSFIVMNLRASGVAVVAGASAAALLVGLSVLIESFDLSLSRWMTTTLQADAFLRAPAAHDSSRPNRLSTEVIEWLQNNPDIKSFNTTSTIEWQIGENILRLEGTEILAALDSNKYQLLSNNLEQAPFNPKTDLIISESTARSLKIQVPQQLKLLDSFFNVRAIFRDYTSERGLIVLDRSTYRQISRDEKVEAVALNLKAGYSISDLQASLLHQFPQHAFTFLSNKQLRGLVQSIFEQTFSITSIVRILVMTICALGFWMLRLQRIWIARREMSTLSVLGVTRRDFFAIAAIEGGILASVAGLIGTLAGLNLAALLVQRINPLSFGWTLDFEISVQAIVFPIILLFAASVFAAIASASIEIKPGMISDE